jgi:hypothetical protein
MATANKSSSSVEDRENTLKGIESLIISALISPVSPTITPLKTALIQEVIRTYLTILDLRLK